MILAAKLTPPKRSTANLRSTEPAHTCGHVGRRLSTSSGRRRRQFRAGFDTMVMLSALDLSTQDVLDELAGRFGVGGRLMVSQKPAVNVLNWGGTVSR